MAAQPAIHTARMMGGFVIDMGDARQAELALQRYRQAGRSPLEVRQTLWGVQVKTDSQAAADALADCYRVADAA